MDKLVRERQELIKANITGMFEKAKKGTPHKQHKYLKIENGKYIYDEKSMTAADHQSAGVLHNDLKKVNDNKYDHERDDKVSDYHKKLSDKHFKLAGEKEKKIITRDELKSLAYKVTVSEYAGDYVRAYDSAIQFLSKEKLTLSDKKYLKQDKRELEIFESRVEKSSDKKNKEFLEKIDTFIREIESVLK